MRTRLLFWFVREIPVLFSNHVNRREINHEERCSFLKTGLYSYSKQARDKEDGYKDVHVSDDLPFSLCSLKGGHMSPLFDEK